MIKKVSFRHRPLAEEDLPKLAKYAEALGQLGVEVISSSPETASIPGVSTVSLREERSFSDMVIVFGGDGSVIKNAREFAPLKVPVLGVNLGHLGYLCELDADDTSFLGPIVSGDYTVDDRMMLDVSVTRDGNLITTRMPALNEVVLANGPISRLLKCELSCDGVHIQSCRADGIIFATPTGSTAYSMSAGGPVADPSLECIIATPICPHTMYQTPVIYGASSVLEIDSVSCRENGVYLTLDGDESIEILPDDRITVRRSSVSTRLIRVKRRSFLRILHDKMS